MKLEEKIVSDLAYELKEKLTKKVIALLKEDKTPLQDEKSCLDTVWEEFCISVQEKDSLYLELDYKKHVLDLYHEKFNELKRYEKVAIWLKTPDGIDWIYDKKDISCALENVPFHFEACENCLYSLILEIAKNYDNDNIYRYIYMGCETFREDYSEDDTEQVYE